MLNYVFLHVSVLFIYDYSTKRHKLLLKTHQKKTFFFIYGLPPPNFRMYFFFANPPFSPFILIIHHFQNPWFSPARPVPCTVVQWYFIYFVFRACSLPRCHEPWTVEAVVSQAVHSWSPGRRRRRSSCCSLIPIQQGLKMCLRTIFWLNYVVCSSVTVAQVC